MRILIGLTYYRPHYSGLTIYAERLARTLASRGHDVTVLTSRFNSELPKDEFVDGVRIVRCSVRFRLSKGVVMPSMPIKAYELIRNSDVVNMHVPQMDAAYLAVMSRMMGKPVVMTYQCDLLLPHGFIHSLANIGSNLFNEVSGHASNVIVALAQDYAEHSPFLRRYLHKVNPILPPIELPAITAEDIDAFRQKHAIQPEQKIIGICARLATEKGVEYLVQAMPEVLKRYPNARVLYNGQYQNVLGEADYARRLEPMVRSLGPHWTYLGIIPAVEQAAFFKVCDVTVLPSINSTEAYGMVQVESMFSGTPVVATDLPGVRHAVRTTGMGKIVPPRDAPAITAAILEILDEPERFQGDIKAIHMRYAPATVASAYESLFEELVEAK